MDTVRAGMRETDAFADVSIEEVVPDIRMVLPAHYGAFETDGRLPEKLCTHHRTMLSVLRQHLKRRMTAVMLAETIFGVFPNIGNRVLSTVEVLSHLQWLESDGSIARHDDDGVSWYESTSGRARGPERPVRRGDA